MKVIFMLLDDILAKNVNLEFFHLKVKMIIFDFCFKFLFSNSLLQGELNLVAMIYCEKYLNSNSLHLLFKL